MFRYLSYNSITSLENVTFPDSLESLGVNWNNIDTIRNVTFPSTLDRFYYVENPITLISLSQEQWDIFLNITDNFVILDGDLSTGESDCVTGYFGPMLEDSFLACVLGKEPGSAESVRYASGSGK